MYRGNALHALLPSQLVTSQLLPTLRRISWGPLGKSAQGHGAASDAASPEADHEEEMLERLNLFAPDVPRPQSREEAELPTGATSMLPEGPVTRAAYREERARVEREIAALRVLIRQSECELEAQQRRQAAAQRAVEQVEGRLEDHTREEIRAVYIHAAEAEMQAFMLAEQLDQSRTKLEAFERYERFLTDAIGALGTSVPEAPAPSDETSALVGTPAEDEMAASAWADEEATALLSPDARLEGDDWTLDRLDVDEQSEWLWDQPTISLRLTASARAQEQPAAVDALLAEPLSPLDEDEAFAAGGEAWPAWSAGEEEQAPVREIAEVANPTGGHEVRVISVVEAPGATAGGADAAAPDEEPAPCARAADEPQRPATERGVVVIEPRAAPVSVLQVTNVRGLSREALRRVARAQEEVAERAARQIRSGAMQSLMSLALDVGMYEQMAQADPAAALEGLGHVRALVNGMLHEHAQSMLNLQPLRPGEQSIVAALRRYATMVSSQCGIPFELAAPHGEVALAAEVATAVFRVAQEALQNAARHSHATLILVMVDFLPDRLSLTVEDDGVGFDARRVMAREYEQGAGGLIGMLERAELLGGRLRMETGPGKGCLVELSIPLEVE